VKLHPVTVARLVIVKTNPRPGGVKLVAHAYNLAATTGERQPAPNNRANFRMARFRPVWLPLDGGL
jgi:hypothetical protein